MSRVICIYHDHYGLCLSASLHLTIWSPQGQGSISLPSLTLFLFLACDLSPSLLSAQCSLLSSPLLSTGQATEQIPGTQNYLQTEKYKQHNLCVTFYKQIWLTLAELDGLFSQFIGWGFSEDCLTPWLPVCCQMSGWENRLFSLTAPTPSSSCTF